MRYVVLLAFTLSSHFAFAVDSTSSTEATPAVSEPVADSQTYAPPTNLDRDAVLVELQSALERVDNETSD